jgi:hypothetical protein
MRNIFKLKSSNKESKVQEKAKKEEMIAKGKGHNDKSSHEESSSSTGFYNNDEDLGYC